MYSVEYCPHVPIFYFVDVDSQWIFQRGQFPVIAGLTNDYADYVTTFEEYQVPFI